MTGQTAAEKPLKLTAKQRAFAEHYAASANATEAARLAGYKGSENQLGVQGSENLRNPKIVDYLEGLTQPASVGRIATAQERQEFWTAVMRGTMTVVVKGKNGQTEEYEQSADMAVRLKASELLGKSQADFVERREVSGPNGSPLDIRGGLSDEQRAAAVAALLSRGETTPGT